MDEVKEEYIELEGIDLKFKKIEADLPDFREKEKYLKKIQSLRELLQQSKDEKIKDATSNINEEYSPLFVNMDEAIRRYELELEFACQFKHVMSKEEIKALFAKIKLKTSAQS